MTLAKKKQLANRIRVLRGRQERKNYKLLQKVFLDFAKEIDKSIKKESDIEIDYRGFKQAMKKTLKKIFNDTIENTITWTKNLFGWQLKENVIETVRSEAIEEYNKNLASQVTGITESTRETLNKIISDGQASGTNLTTIVSNIVDKVENMADWRAKRIALTETNSAVNNTDYKMALESGIKTKTWIHVGGGFEDRESHLALDGKTIPIKEKFNVNGYKGSNPVAIELPLKERISCHCICIYD